ncbi:MAG: lamin tail domain-containing protein, partial [Bacteroidota bacterium]|nr:lamin tail domain-containing protein [Bacteroidota bacterium]
MINEIGIGATSGDSGGGGEFIELYNKSGCTINIGCHVLVYSGTSLGSAGWSVTIPAGTMLGAGQYYLIGGHSSNLLFSSSWT